MKVERGVVELGLVRAHNQHLATRGIHAWNICSFRLKGAFVEAVALETGHINAPGNL